MQKISQFFQKNYLLLTLFAASIGTRIFYFGRPNEIVFDEVYFGKFVINYFSASNYFDIHPPFGKLLIFFFAKIFGFNFLENVAPETLLADPKNLFILRLMPLIFGVLLIPLVYKFVELISKSKKTAALSTFFILSDNAFLIYSHYLFLDIILVFFGILALYLFFLGLNYQRKEKFHISCDRIKCEKTTTKGQILYFLLSALVLGATISIKWTGLAIFGIIIATLIWKTVRKGLTLKISFVSLVIFIIIPVIFYLATFAIHFALLKKSGPDDGFFSTAYLKTLKNYSASPDIMPLSFFGKFKEINKTMFTSNSKLSATHPYSSKWWQWPFSQKPIYLWQGKIMNMNMNKKTANLWLFGNLIIWLASFLGIVFTAIAILFKRLRKKLPTIIFWLLFAYLANLLPFIFIKRVLFLYHYFFAITFAIIILSIFLERIMTLYPKYKIAVYLFLILTFIFFIVFSPLSYGFSESVRLYNFQLKIIL
ncbi:MAG: phospholipid carrier-dependent glycosyltransferase [Patescibacteria group bacterium]